MTFRGKSSSRHDRCRIPFGPVDRGLFCPGHDGLGPVVPTPWHLPTQVPAADPPVDPVEPDLVRLAGQDPRSGIGDPQTAAATHRTFRRVG